MICKLYQFRLFSPPPHQLQIRFCLGNPVRHRQALAEAEQGKQNCGERYEEESGGEGQEEVGGGRRQEK